MKTINRNTALCLCILTLSLALVSCGIYSFSGSTLPAHIKTVAVPLFDNKTAEFGIDQQITDALVSSITQDNSLKIADNRSADSILRGTIVTISERAGAYDRNEQASGFRVTISVKVVYEDVKKRKTLWEENWSQWGDYEGDRTAGIDEAISKLITDILNRMVSGW